jgi:hypothetical protein
MRYIDIVYPGKEFLLEMAENWQIHWKDYYRILQIHPLAEPEVVKAAYERLARKYHPDKNQGAASDRMKDLNEAFEVISDAVKRGRYYSVYCRRMMASPGIPRPRDTAPPVSANEPVIVTSRLGDTIEFVFRLIGILIALFAVIFFWLKYADSHSNVWLFVAAITSLLTIPFLFRLVAGVFKQ